MTTLVQQLTDQAAQLERVITEEVALAADPVLEEVGVQIDLLDAQGAKYVRSYLRHIIAGETHPGTPRGMHHKIAAALRDLAMDQAMADRLYGNRARRAATRR